jgi:hypothetical protein
MTYIFAFLVGILALVAVVGALYLLWYIGYQLPLFDENKEHCALAYIYSGIWAVFVFALIGFGIYHLGLWLISLVRG